jgi:hypothetical protein
MLKANSRLEPLADTYCSLQGESVIASLLLTPFTPYRLLTTRVAGRSGESGWAREFICNFKHLVTILVDPDK